MNSSFITLHLVLTYLNQKTKPMKKLLSILSICLVFISCTSTPEEKIAYATKEELSAAALDMKVMIEEIKAMIPTKEASVRLFREECVIKTIRPGGAGTRSALLYYFNGELFNGVAFDIHSNGQLKFEIYYKDGKRNGKSKSWYKNGQLQSEKKWKDNEENGVGWTWHQNGQLQSEGIWKDGEIDGLYQEWDYNGQLYAKSNYKDGVKQ